MAFAVAPTGGREITMASKEEPPGWGEKGLSEFFEMARRNQHGTFANHKAETVVLEEIDAAFYRIASNLLNPQDHLTPVFLYRAHSAYRAACAAAMAGQTVETFVLLRSCLEFGSLRHTDCISIR
jgi:hypothetical protein